MPGYHFERALFIVGKPGSGKSTQLRSMFRDARFGRSREIPTTRNLQTIYWLSNERYLYLRLTSPHEARESLSEFLEKTYNQLRRARSGFRGNFACPLWPEAAYRMSDAVETCEAFVARFRPERIRLVLLSPDRRGAYLQEGEHALLVDRLKQIVPAIELCWIDARERTGNGLLLADFFDFT